MLLSLEIRDMLIIDHLAIEPGAGLNVLTGETGAGKSILLDSLGFVLGWRGRSDMVRAGQDQGEVVAVFDLGPDHAARIVLEEAGIACEGELILRRVNRADGRKSAWVNDRRVSGEVLRALSDVLVELHGQQDDRGLLNPRNHRLMLDAFGALDGQVAACRKAWRAVSAARKELDQAEAGLAEIAAEEEFLRHAWGELEALAPEPGEEAALDTKRRLMQGAERIGADIAKAREALGAGEGAEGRLSDVLNWLQGAQDQAGEVLAAPIAAILRALDEVSDGLAGVEAAQAALQFNPFELEAVEERLFAIRALARKHGVAPDDLAAFAADLNARLQALDQGEGNIAALKAALAKARSVYEGAAGKLTGARRKAAARLDRAMAAELHPLKMERAVFQTDIAAADPGPEGADAVQFTVATNPGAPSGPLNKIASGGELSRFLLALKVCLTGNQSGVTMIFDEIDRGVGGATAAAVGRRLSDLARSGQILVVTHSPQVAAFGQHHWQVSKRITGGETLSSVTVLDADARIDEVARMLAGDVVTDEARAAAVTLLKTGAAA